MGNAKTIYPSLNGKNSASVSDVRSYGCLHVFKDTIDNDKVQILTWNLHHLTFLFTCKYFHDHLLTEAGLPIFELETLKLFIHL